jgi:ABC-type sugar transport system ATPase subunit
VVLTSSDLEETVGLGDTVVTMFRGRQVATYARNDVTMARVVADITHPIAGQPRE